MAYAKQRELLRLAQELEASAYGLTISELMNRMECSRRSVERMLASLSVLGLEARASQVEGDHHLTKRWRLDKPLPASMLVLQAGERAALELVLASMSDGPARQGLLKLLAGQTPPAKNIAIDQATLLERTAYLGTVGPRYDIPATLIEAIEKGIKGLEQLDILYRSEAAPSAITRRVKPLGIVFARFGYLVALAGKREPQTFRLNLIEDAKLTGKLFTQPAWFKLKDWAGESFGIYHGDDKIQVVLRFSPLVSARAESIKFHQSEKKERLSDGSLIMTLNCKGHRELIWELCHPDWAGQVMIEHPDSLVQEFNAYLEILR